MEEALSKTLIFDFDGTIANTMSYIIEIINENAQKFKYKTVRQEEVDKLRKRGLQDIFRELDIKLWQLPFIVQIIRTELRKKIFLVKPAKGLKEVLTQLKHRGYVLGIMSSNSEENIKNFLEKNKIAIFDFIYSGSSVFGKDKVLNLLLKKEYLKAKDVVYIGDETRDIEAAKKVGIRCIAVTWGFQKRDILFTRQPDYLIDKPKELLRLKL